MDKIQRVHGLQAVNDLQGNLVAGGLAEVLTRVLLP